MQEQAEHLNPHQTQFSIYMMGAPESGKSSLLQRYIDNKCETEFKLEINVPILKHSIINGSPIGMNLYDNINEQYEQGNKIDLKADREVERSNAIEKATFDLGGQVKYIECSALTGEGVDEVFDQLKLILINTAKKRANRQTNSSCCNLF